LQLVNSTLEDVGRKEGLTSDAVQGLWTRRMTTTVQWTEFERLTVIGIDEIACKKGHRDFGRQFPVISLSSHCPCWTYIKSEGAS
jgi:hypothetical protein